MQLASSLFVQTAILITVPLLYAQTALAQPAQRSVYARYGPIKSQKFVAAEAIVKKGRVLERLADLLSALLRLPSPIFLTFQECGRSNALFVSQTRALVFCYELMEEIDQRASRDLAGSPELARRIKADAFVFVLFHELGHALIHTLDLLFTGKEEDVADEIATYLALKAAGIGIIQGGVWFFSKRNLFSTYTNRHFADQHSLNEQRQFNIACWAYGKDPRLFAPLAQNLRLPVERARRCRGEYTQMARAIELLLRDSWNDGQVNADSPVPNRPSPAGTYQIIRSTSVFEQPSDSSREVAVVTQGTRVVVVGSSGDWLEVRSKLGRPPGFIRRDDAMFIDRAN